MSPYKLAILDKAQKDALRIKSYIKNILYNQKAANDFVEELDRKFRAIIKEPHLYPQNLFGRKLYHCAIVKKYIIAFRIDEQAHTVYIIAIGHSLQKRRNIIKPN